MAKPDLRFALLVVIGLGCQDTERPTGPGEAAKSSSVSSSSQGKKGSASGAVSKKKSRPVRIKRTSMAGNWVLQSILIQQNRGPDWLSLALIRISAEKDGSFKTALLQTRTSIKGLKSATVKQKSAKLVLIAANGASINCRFTLDGTMARGNYRLTDQSQATDPVRLLATNDKSLERYAELQDPLHVQEFKSAGLQLSKTKNDTEMRAVIRKFSKSPLSLYLQQMFWNKAGGRGQPPDAKKFVREAETLIALAAHWGPRYQQQFRILTASILVGSRALPQRTVKFLSEAAANFKVAESSENEKAMVRNLKNRAEIEIELNTISSTKGAAAAAAVASLKKRLLKNHFHPLVSFGIARYAQLTGDNKTAIENYALLAAFPMLKTDLDIYRVIKGEKPYPLLEQLEELWKTKPEGIGSLQSHLEKVYSATIDRIVARNQRPIPANPHRRTVLCELFSSSVDPRSISADLALSAIERTFPPADVIALRFHRQGQSDPLMSEVCADRHFQYQGPQVPALFVNGKRVALLAGTPPDTMFYVEKDYDLIRQAVEAAWKGPKPDFQISLKANANGDAITLVANVSQADGQKKPTDDLWLRLVVAEDRVKYTSRNGIRFHDMLVRLMPGGSDGIRLKQGKAEFRKTISFSKMKRALLDNLVNYEQQTSSKLPAKPLDLKKLTLVAFIQNERTRKILHSVAVPISGLPNSPDKAKSAKTTDKKKAGKKKAGKKKADGKKADGKRRPARAVKPGGKPSPKKSSKPTVAPKPRKPARKRG